eukprot:1869084-Rhodomonas_salina.1
MKSKTAFAAEYNLYHWQECAGGFLSLISRCSPRLSLVVFIMMTRRPVSARVSGVSASHDGVSMPAFRALAPAILAAAAGCHGGHWQVRRERGQRHSMQVGRSNAQWNWRCL